MGHSGCGVKPPFTDLFAVKVWVVLGFVVQGTHKAELELKPKAPAK